MARKIVAHFAKQATDGFPAEHQIIARPGGGDIDFLADFQAVETAFRPSAVALVYT